MKYKDKIIFSIVCSGIIGYIFNSIKLTFIISIALFIFWTLQHIFKKNKQLGEGERGYVKLKIKRLVLEKQRDICAVKGCFNRDYLQLHHIIPRNMGGDNRVSNLSYLCPLHHAAMHDSGNGKVSYKAKPIYLRR